MRLLALLVRWMVWFVPTLLGLLAVTFVISRVIPADPVALVAGETATPAQVAALRKQLGYDRPLGVQFVAYVSGLARGDMGTSIFTRRPIAEDLAHRLPATIELTLAAMVASVAVGIPLSAVEAEAWRTTALYASFLVAGAVLARIGTDSLAAHQVAFQLFVFLALVLDAVAIAGQVIVGRSLGAGDAEEAYRAA